MRKGITALTVFLMLGGTVGHSQSRFAEFNSFRSKILTDFQSFRSRVLEHYADFLDGEWHEFEAILEEESPYTAPKPDTAPGIEMAQEDAMVTNMMLTRLPDANAADLSLPGLTAIAHGEGLEHFYTPRDAEGKSNFELAARKIPDPGFAVGPFPGQLKAPAPGESGLATKDGSASSASTPSEETGNKDNFLFDFYGMEAFIPSIGFEIAESVASTDETGANWKKMAAQEGGKETARQLFGLAQQLGLNGYLTFRLTESYVNQRFPGSDGKSRMAAVHFLLSNMGYDARLSEMGDVWTVMLPFDQKVVYGLFPKTMDGRKYYAMFPEGYEKPKGSKIAIKTCELPSDALGKTSDLRLAGLNLPMKPREFEISRNGITIKGTVNENIRALLYRYPQMPAGDFASSWIDQQLRDDIVEQIKSQVNGMGETQAINTLMSVCHYGFEYATDQKYHGFEKPYFLEENFIYDYNDCEDRAIFFSYVVWNALGLPCQLIQYPGHESVAIAAVTDIDGCYYDDEGTKYYSSDPTYRGSRIGQVMPTFKEASPTVDKHYR